MRETLRSAILRGDLPGDTRLVQTEIANQLEVSTTPVREAMRDLASEGLITLDSHRIGTVRKPDWEEMSAIVDIRRALERLALEGAIANITPKELAKARSLADQLAGDVEIGNWVQANNDFHSVFHRAIPIKRLATFVESLESAGGVFVAQAQRLHPEIRARAVADHYSLIEAVESGDLEGAVEIQYEHVSLPLAGNPATDGLAQVVANAEPAGSTRQVFGNEP
ncbi:MAG TPA: GntR family transcriptional regulator [Acidimicrobiia bacterium]|nr:GntR family transcriptional regulator [Acidimicrobiia bacterium]